MILIFFVMIVVESLKRGYSIIKMRKLRYNNIKPEIRDFRCRLCGAMWLDYIKKTDACGSAYLHDGRHNFDFGRPIRINSHEEEIRTSEDKVPDGKIIFQ